MLRCVLPALLALGVSAATSLPASAQMQRLFPANALRGQLQLTQPPELLINGQPARLSPGARIRGTDNLFKVSGALLGSTLTVNYTLEASGAVHDVWLLTAAEAARQPWPTTLEQARRWAFDPAAQAWTQR